MISVFYILFSVCMFGIFGLLATPMADLVALRQQTHELTAQNLQIPAYPAPTPISTPTGSPQAQIFLADQIGSELVVPTPNPNQDNYVVEAIGGGFFKLLNVPNEPMSTVDQLHDAVNQFRATHGLGTLETDPHLCTFADQRAHEVEVDFSHTKFSEHIDNGIALDWGFTNFGENIWQGSFMGVHIVEYGWAKSPGHFAALVGNWTKGCAGIFDDSAVYIFAR